MDFMITFDQYRANKVRIKKAEKLLEDDDLWDSPDPKHQIWVKKYSELLESVLEFESFHKIGWAASPIKIPDEALSNEDK